MRTAETIVREYLDRGYSVECLRVLAESRPEPLCSEMLAILETVREEAARPEDAEESVAEAAGEIFFVADDNESVAEGDALDFDVMADPIIAGEEPEMVAAEEESVADIFIGETEGSDIVNISPAPEFADVAERPVAVTAPVDEVVADDPVAVSEMPAAFANEDTGEYGAISGGEESTAAMYGSDLLDLGDPAAIATFDKGEAGASYVFRDGENALRTTDDISDILGTLDESASAPAVVDAPSFDSEPDIAEAPAVSEPEAVAEFEASSPDIPASAEAAAPTQEEAVEPAARTSSDDISDYLPGPVGESDESMQRSADIEAGKNRLLEAKAALDRVMEAAGLAASSISAPSALAASADVAAPDDSAANRGEGEEQLSRKERRRRDRAEKKRRRGRAAADIVASEEAEASEMPEIVLTRSEGAESMFKEEAAESVAPPAVESVVEDAADTEAASAAPIRFDPEPEADDHLMILANGGLDLRRDAYRLLGEDPIDEPTEDTVADEPAAEDNNVILFRLNPSFSQEDEIEAENEVEEEGPRLRMLSPAEPVLELDESDDADVFAPVCVPAGEEEAKAADGTVLSPIARLGLLRALSGSARLDADESGTDAPMTTESADANEHVVVAVEPEAEDPVAKLAEAQAEMEREYQVRLDDFARRLLESQSVLAQSEGRVTEARAEAEARAAIIKDLNARLAGGEKRLAAAKESLANALSECEGKDKTIQELLGVREEHERLYAEFEDLRRGYNELVTEVLPNLQNERDDLALTVERQCGDEEQLRSTLGGVRRRLAVGYTLGAAACLMLVGLPIFNWLRSDAAAKQLAINHQQATELVQRLKDAELKNVSANKNIVDLNRQLDKVTKDLKAERVQSAKMTEIADKRTKELASLKASGTPTRAVTMALSGPPAADGRLRRNEVRDPAGEIDQVVARNREQNAGDRLSPAGRDGSSRIPVSAVAMNTNGRASPLRPAAEATQASAAPKADEILAEVKPKEGVAQVVYRTLGTADPEVINWVIRENNIKRDKRGNPIIHPNQKLRLPKDGRITQAASAAARR